MHFPPISTGAQYGDKDAFNHWREMLSVIGRLAAATTGEYYGSDIRSVSFLFRIGGKFQDFVNDGHRVRVDNINKIVSCDIVIPQLQWNGRKIELKPLADAMKLGSNEVIQALKKGNYDFHFEKLTGDIDRLVQNICQITI